MARLVYGVAVTDTATLAGSVVLFMAIALVARVVPAWQASTIDPVRALRDE